MKIRNFEPPLVSRKNREVFIFFYEQGCEGELLDVMAEQVKSKRTSFDSFDAAVLTLILSERLISQVDEVLSEFF